MFLFRDSPPPFLGTCVKSVFLTTCNRPQSAFNIFLWIILNSWPGYIISFRGFRKAKTYTRPVAKLLIKMKVSDSPCPLNNTHFIQHSLPVRQAYPSTANTWMVGVLSRLQVPQEDHLFPCGQSTGIRGSCFSFGSPPFGYLDTTIHASIDHTSPTEPINHIRR